MMLDLDRLEQQVRNAARSGYPFVRDLSLAEFRELISELREARGMIRALSCEIEFYVARMTPESEVPEAQGDCNAVDSGCRCPACWKALISENREFRGLVRDLENRIAWLETA